MRKYPTHHDEAVMNGAPHSGGKYGEQTTDLSFRPKRSEVEKPAVEYDCAGHSYMDIKV